MLTATTLEPFDAGVATVDIACDFGAAGAGVGSGSSSLSGCSISRSFGDCSGCFGSSFGVRGFSTLAVGGAVVSAAGAGTER